MTETEIMTMIREKGSVIAIVGLAIALMLSVTSCGSEKDPQEPNTPGQVVTLDTSARDSSPEAEIKRLSDRIRDTLLAQGM